MREVVDRHDHLAAVKERYVAVRYVQNVGAFLAQLAVRELELFLVAVDAANEGNMLRDFVVRFEVLRYKIVRTNILLDKIYMVMKLSVK